jgi:hypothetical protein
MDLIERKHGASRRGVAAAFVLAVVASALAACSDVGDTSALPGNSDAEAEDGSAAGDSTVTSAGDALAESSAQDATTAADSAADVLVEDVTAPQDTGTLEETGVPPDAEAPETSVVPEASVVEEASTDAGSAPDVADSAVVESSTADVASQDAGVDSTIEDSGPAADAEGDVVAEAGPSEASVEDAGAPDTGTSETDTGVAETGAGTEAGGAVVPCTVTGQANCVECSGSTGGVCTPTEAIFVQYDISQGIATPSGGDGAGCYSCLVSGSCLDDPRHHVAGRECGDLPGDFDAGAGAGQLQSSLCLAAVQCIAQTSCDQANLNDGISYCYCGAGGGSPTNCETHGASANGACFTPETLGFRYAPTDGTDIVSNFNDTSQPSGLANQIFTCAQANTCPCP